MQLFPTFQPYDNGGYLYYPYYSPDTAYVLETKREKRLAVGFHLLAYVITIIFMYILAKQLGGELIDFLIAIIVFWPLDIIFESLWKVAFINKKPEITFTLNRGEKAHLKIKHMSMFRLIILNLAGLLLVFASSVEYFEKGNKWWFVAIAFFSLLTVLQTKDIFEKLKQRKDS